MRENKSDDELMKSKPVKKYDCSVAVVIPAFWLERISNNIPNAGFDAIVNYNFLYECIWLLAIIIALFQPKQPAEGNAIIVMFREAQCGQLQ